MDRSGPKTGHVQKEPSETPVEVEPVAEAAPAARQPVPTGWRIALFLWVTAFGFLAAYELLWTLFKLLKIR
jgi:hypothetical protein